MSTLSQARLKDMLVLDQERSQLYWRRDIRQMKAGSRAGAITTSGYWVIRLDGKYYREHRLIWLWHSGEWPVGDVDHIDGDRLNNRIDNLRVATRSQNECNKPCKGYYLTKNNRYHARIKLNGQRIHLGVFDDEDAARAAYADAAFKYHGEFSHLSRPNGGQTAGASHPSAISSPGAQ